VAALRGALDVDIDEATTVVTLSVRLRWPEVSQQVASRMIALVNEFNTRRLQAQADARRRFSGEMVASAETALRLAESRLEAFVQRNRVFANDPRLALEHGRLSREVQFRQGIYSSLASSYEQARIDAVRDTPLITIVESPFVPVSPDGRGTVLKTVGSFVLAISATLLFVFLREFFSRSREREPDRYAQFAALRGQTIADVRRILPLSKKRRATAP
jgi:uncharacterized protein involved in exopolysaccharide biosynthesis